MTTIIPLFIPVDHTPSKCPKCGKDEDKGEVCNHCGYKYPDEAEASWLSYALFLIMIVIIPFWFIITFIQWTMPYQHETLADVLWNQAMWLAELAGRII